MLPDLSVSDADLAGLEEELGGCDFGSAECRSFLESRDSRDVQAAPGSGKTTLLVAKLLLLVRRWTEPTRGICVVSHTNVARREVERRVTNVEAAQLLGHPHFIGTVTTFIHRFVALPFLRGLGWPVSAVDDEVFAHRAHRAMLKNAFLRKQLYLQHNERRFAQWARALTLCDSFCPGTKIPDRVPLRDLSGMPGEHTDTRKAFEAIKAEVLSQGLSL